MGGGPGKQHIDYDSIPGASELTVRLLNPFGRSGLPKIPNLIQVIAASMLAHRPQEIALGEKDILISPPVSAAISFMDWSRHSELFAEAYYWAKSWIDERIGENDPRMEAICGLPARYGSPETHGSAQAHSAL
ncbi:hypothetical protein [Ensifer adhaerens]|uniref:hypothetical protein n=1 Tax=Ensifer adhaerens TaxID=106592 RepID=UPI000FDC7590|nr:hypothetical protein [Ensifer adhaerens]MDF8358403.1 hypothetical protein [Ensifer adhaerens]THA59565.1 hypothetical protein E5176_31380 [Ensifer adhaerens]